MPLINCPDCGKKLSTEAPACPHCGRPMKFGFLERGQTTKPQFWHDPNVGCVAAGVLVVVALVFILRSC